MHPNYLAVNSTSRISSRKMANRSAKKYGKLKEKLGSTGWLASGSLMKLYRTCGKPGCACAKDKMARHGPYLVWTRKVGGKTITRTLSELQAKECRRAIENLQRLEDVVEEMKDISAQVIETDVDDSST